MFEILYHENRKMERAEKAFIDVCPFFGYDAPIPDGQQSHMKRAPDFLFAVSGRTNHLLSGGDPVQHRITTPGPLHDEKGRLVETGYATELIKTYDRLRVAANRMRIKEWDYYAVCCDRFAFALTIDHNGYMTMDSISLLDFEENFQVTASKMSVPFLSKRSLPATSERGNIRVSGKGYEMAFDNDGVVRHLYGRMDPFSGEKAVSFDLTLTDAPKESMVIITPYRDHPKAFYYNQKINCIRVSGIITYGDREYTCTPEDTFAVLDWGRGVWTYDNTWYWGSASGLVGGVPFGFNIGYGFGDTSAASENVLFVDGKIHKLSQVRFHIPEKDGQPDYLSPWTFSSDDGRFELKFEPLMDRSAKINAGIICSDQHQVFGRFSGTVVTDDGRRLEISRLTGFAEKVRNKW